MEQSPHGAVAAEEKRLAPGLRGSKSSMRMQTNVRIVAEREMPRIAVADGWNTR
jgi:hypothetical protein